MKAADKIKAKAILRYARAEIGDDAKLMRILTFAADQFDGPGDGTALLSLVLADLAKEGESNPIPPEPSTPATPVSVDDGLTAEQLAGARLVGKKNRFSLSIPTTRKMLSAKIEGDHSRTSFVTLNWPQKGGKKTTDGGCVIAWLENGVLYYGIFDWHGVGQTYKTMDNIMGGYMDGRHPPPGAPVWFAIVNYAYTERTTLKRSENNWR